MLTKNSGYFHRSFYCELDERGERTKTNGLGTEVERYVFKSEPDKTHIVKIFFKKSSKI